VEINGIVMAIEGLNYVAGFIDEPAQRLLLEAIDLEPWLTDLKRRVQHYGYKYDYKARKIDRSMYLGALPIWAQPVAERLLCEGYMKDIPDQLIVNEYEPGQGIAAHVDCIPCFGSIVCSITLGSHCTMELSEMLGLESETLLLECGSLLVLAGASRYNWKHGIPARKNDKIGGQLLRRSRRVSLTFRTVII
jgi:alkylated DNA repair dioxygenase AlkB